RPGAAPGGRTWAVDRPNGARAARVEVVPATAARPAVAWWVPDRSAGVGSGPGKGFHLPRTGGLRWGTLSRWWGSGVFRAVRCALLRGGWWSWRPSWQGDRKSTRLNSSHVSRSYAVS